MDRELTYCWGAVTDVTLNLSYKVAGLCLTFCVTVLCFFSLWPSIPCHAHIDSDTCEHRPQHKYSVVGFSRAVMGQIDLWREDMFICLRCILALAPRSTIYIEQQCRKHTCTAHKETHTNAHTFTLTQYILHITLSGSFPAADKVCSLPWERERERGVITPDCGILCQTSSLQMTISWLESILYYQKATPTVTAYIGSLIKSQRTVHNMHWAWRVHITDHFSRLLFYRHPIREIRAALRLAYQIATL